MYERRDSPQTLGQDAPFSGLLARLERDGGNDRHDREHAAVLDEPLTPELVLVDPELARRARETFPPLEPIDDSDSLSEQEPLFGFIQPTTHVLEREPPRAKRRRGRWIAVLVVVAIAAAVALARAEPVTDLFSQSHESRTTPVRRAKSAPPVSRSQPPRTSKSAQKPHARSTRTTAPSHRAAQPQGRSATPGPAPPTRTFVWVAVPKATYYFVQFYRGGREIFTARPSSPRLLLPGAWTFKGRRYRLTPGRYSWSVRPGFGRRSASRYGQPVVLAKLVVQRGSGG